MTRFPYLSGSYDVVMAGHAGNDIRDFVIRLYPEKRPTTVVCISIWRRVAWEVDLENPGRSCVLDYPLTKHTYLRGGTSWLENKLTTALYDGLTLKHRANVSFGTDSPWAVGVFDAGVREAFWAARQLHRQDEGAFELLKSINPSVISQGLWGDPALSLFSKPYPSGKPVDDWLTLARLGQPEWGQWMAALMAPRAHHGAKGRSWTALELATQASALCDSGAVFSRKLPIPEVFVEAIAENPPQLLQVGRDEKRPEVLAFCSEINQLRQLLYKLASEGVKRPCIEGARIARLYYWIDHLMSKQQCLPAEIVEREMPPFPHPV